MARIYRQTYTEAVPNDAQIVVRKGTKYAKFKRRGKVITARLSIDESRIIRETTKWYVEYKDSDGKLRCKPAFRDRRASEQYANELEKTAEHIRSGYKPKEHEQLCRPLKDHLEEFKRHLLAKATSSQQVREVGNKILRIISNCGFTRWADITATKVENYLAELRTDKPEKRGISAQTSNWYLQSIKSFCKWMHQERRAPQNPLAHLLKLNVRTDRRHDRRALATDECQRLLKVTTEEPMRFRMSGPERALLYLTALESGLRASELKSLTAAMCDFDSEIPTLTVKAAYSKRRREDIQPIPPSLTTALKAYTENCPADELVFRTMPPIDRLARMLRVDLQAAKIEYRDGAGRVVDFHALRHTYITNLARSGVHPKIAMDLARHSDINLTLARYSHTVIRERAEVLHRLPKLTEGNDEPTMHKKTGTNDSAA